MNDISVENEHDIGYKGIFSKKKNFIHFLRKYIQADWVDNIDETDLTLIDTTMIEADYQHKESDVIYKIKFRNSEVIFYILLELQSSVDQTMPFRLLRYMTELMKREFDNAPKNERERVNYRLPPVVPVILYNGADNWTVLRSFKEYLQGYQTFGEYIIDFRYFLFDLNRITEETILSSKQLLDMVFALDKRPTRKDLERMLKIVSTELKNMSSEDKNDLFRWLRGIWLNYIDNEVEKDRILGEFEKGEVQRMMYGIEMWVQEERQKGKKEEKKEITQKMLKRGDSIEDIIDLTGLSRKEIEKIQADLKEHL